MNLYSLILKAKIKKYPTERLIDDPLIFQELMQLVPEPLATVELEIYWLVRIRLMTILEFCRRTQFDLDQVYHSDVMDEVTAAIDHSRKSPSLKIYSDLNNVISGPWDKRK